MVHQYTCKSLTEYKARKAEVNKLSYIQEYCIYIRFMEWTPLLMWASDPTVNPENWRAYSYCDTAEGMKETAQLYYWFRITTAFFDDFSGTFQHVRMVLCNEKCPEIVKFLCPEIFFYCAHACKLTKKSNWHCCV